VDSVWTEIFQKINEFYEQNEIKNYNNVLERSVYLVIYNTVTQINLFIWKQLDTKHICHFCIDIISRFTFGKRKYE
jgi:hypothetical protein